MRSIRFIPRAMVGLFEDILWLPVSPDAYRRPVTRASVHGYRRANTEHMQAGVLNDQVALS